MSTFNFRQVSAAIYIIILFLVACSVTSEETVQEQTAEARPLTERRGTGTEESLSSPPPEASAATPQQVDATVSKHRYRAGETVRFTISHHSDRPVYYFEGGCTWPFIVQLEGEDETQLAINITEEEIPLQQLAAGETFSCEWNQIAWRTEDVRFSQVPPGHYQVKFPYVSEETDVGSGDKWKEAGQVDARQDRLMD